MSFGPPHPPQRPLPAPQQPWPHQPGAQSAPYAAEPHRAPNHYAQPHYAGHAGHAGHPHQPLQQASPYSEFGPAEDAVTRGTARWAFAAMAATGLIAGANFLAGSVIPAAVGLGVAYAMHKGHQSLQAVTMTRGQDADHLVKAFDHFGGAFHLRLIVTLLGAAALGLSAVLIASVRLAR